MLSVMLRQMLYITTRSIFATASSSLEVTQETRGELPHHFKLVNMYPGESKMPGGAAGHEGTSQFPSSPSKEAAYFGAYKDLFGSDAAMKARIVAHPLFEQLLAAHVACLRVATPVEEQHVIDSALAERHHVAAKYLALLTHLQSVSQPANNQELSHFMVSYILLLQSFKEKLLEHLRIQASEAISSCQEIEQDLFNLTGVFSSFNHKGLFNMIKEHKQNSDEKPEDGFNRLGISYFLPYDVQKELRDHVRRELKQELKEDYHAKLKEVHDEILRKRRAGKLPDDTTHLLKDWWISHANWPYPTEEEKAQLVEETGLDLKQINNWFINQRKRNWQSERNTAEAFDRT